MTKLSKHLSKGGAQNI